MALSDPTTTEETDMAECDGEKVVTMMDVLQEQEEFEEDANAVLGASDDKNCTFSKGYIKRQAIYACMTCCTEARTDPTKRAGVCLACSLTCHENHELVELYTKRNFCCDCGNPKFNSHPCQFNPDKTDLNENNTYNQNFSGVYCVCHRPYPDPEASFEDEMIQCIICEDWLHASHLEATVPPNDQYSEMICKACMQKNEFLHDYSNYAVNVDKGEVDIISSNTLNGTSICNGDSDSKSEELKAVDNNRDDNFDKTSKQEKADTDIVGEIPESHQTLIEKAEDEEMEVDQSGSENITDDTLNKKEEPIESKQPHENVTKDDHTDVNVPQNEILTESESEITNSPNKKYDTESVLGPDEISNDISTTVNNAISSEKTKDEALPEVTTTGDQVKLNMQEENTENKEINNTDTTVPPLENQEEINTMDTEDSKTNTDSIEIPKEPNRNINEPEPTNDTTEGEKDDVLENIDKIINANNEDKSNDVNDKVENASGTDRVSENKVDNITNDVDMHDDSVKVDITDSVTKTENNETVNDNQNKTNKTLNDDSADNETANDNAITDKTINNDSVDNAITENDDSENKIVASCETEADFIKHETEDNVKINEQTETQKSMPEQVNENKRKPDIEIEEIDDSSMKKPKLSDDKKCIRPKGVKKLFKGATFWPSNFRQKLCTCYECITMYKDLSVLFLIDPEDTVTAYETLGKEKTNGTTASQYEKGLQALSSLDRIQQINALTEYNKMRDKLLDFLKSFKDRKEIVKEEDIKAFFAGMKPKREPDGVYFCR